MNRHTDRHIAGRISGHVASGSSSRKTAVLAVATMLLLVAVMVFGVVRASEQTAARTAVAAASAADAAVASSPVVPPIVAVGAEADAPWPAPGDPTARAAAAGLRMLGTEGTTEHIHVHLTVSLDGVVETVPAEVGIEQSTGTVSPLHTHDTSGIVHIESPVYADFTLGQFFTEWNVALDATRIGAYSTSDAHTLTVFVDGVAVTGDPAAIVLSNKTNVDVVYAPAGTTPTAPAPFVWPSNY